MRTNLHVLAKLCRVFLESLYLQLFPFQMKTHLVYICQCVGFRKAISLDLNLTCVILMLPNILHCPERYFTLFAKRGQMCVLSKLPHCIFILICVAHRQ